MKSRTKLVALLLASGIFFLLGFALVVGVPTNPVFGVRIAETHADPAVWRSVNAGTGLAMAVASFVAFFGAAGADASIVAASTLFALPIAAAIAGAAFPSAASALSTLLPAKTATTFSDHVRIACALALPLALGGVGVLLMKGQVPPNRLLGFRTDKILASDAAWYRGNRAGGRVLYGGAAICVLAICAVVLSDASARVLPPISALSALLITLVAFFAALQAAA